MGHVSSTPSGEATTCTLSCLARRDTSVSSATPSSHPSADSSSTPRTNSPGQRSATPPRPRIRIMCGTVENIPRKELATLVSIRRIRKYSHSAMSQVLLKRCVRSAMSQVLLKRCVRSALLFVGYTKAILCWRECVALWHVT